MRRSAAMSASRALLAGRPWPAPALNESARVAFESGSACSSPQHDMKRGCFAQYLQQRGFFDEEEYAAADEESRHAAVAVLSAALTYPLTIARAWKKLVPSSADSVKLCIIGASREATLPAYNWSELSVLTGSPRIVIECTGPAAKAPDTVPREWQSADSTLRVSLGAADLFHRTALGQALLKRYEQFDRNTGEYPSLGSLGFPDEPPDAYVLFNPGLSDPEWERAWKPTLRALEASERPLLMTALSEEDAARDDDFMFSNHWAPLLSFAAEGTPLEPNPYASLLASDAEEGAAVEGSTPPLSNAMCRVMHELGVRHPKRRYGLKLAAQLGL